LKTPPIIFLILKSFNIKYLKNYKVSKVAVKGVLWRFQPPNYRHFQDDNLNSIPHHGIEPRSATGFSFTASFK
jgi:hypothetical protein